MYGQIIKTLIETNDKPDESIDELEIKMMDMKHGHLMKTKTMENFFWDGHKKDGAFIVYCMYLIYILRFKWYQ